MRSLPVLLMFGLVGHLLPIEAATEKVVAKKMGSRFEITAVHPDAAVARAAIEAAYAEIDRLEAMISSWRDDSETTRINRAAGRHPVAVSPELFGLIRRASKISALTDGVFDISFAGAGQLWDFKAADPKLPDPKDLAGKLALVDYRRIALDAPNRTVFLEKPGMRLGFGAIGKGFAANRAVHVLKERGISSGVVNAGGDLVAFGQREDGSPWSVAIADPQKRDSVFAWLNIREQAVVTSGDYERFVTIDGKRYSHILNPKTGFPANDLRSVTIICPDGEVADALATAVFIMGRGAGLDLVNRLKGVEAILVTAEGELRYSDQIQTQLDF
ncbi:FAD:protein FMN transferase [Sulfidibacter corallicola]|uniref:FAD:protein FMN transferase n=1 Tax=Sulfidibacter corallicola TaxID=2818388 RepID=A0A8A4TQK7_SULCO|nr:FAD:protein FMN transferase [Sulfidibacter corallicola]QTD51372.1 FAD:protein FMN transferase [Sulfidibacter corallicola]